MDKQLRPQVFSQRLKWHAVNGLSIDNETSMLSIDDLFEEIRTTCYSYAYGHIRHRQDAEDVCSEAVKDIFTILYKEQAIDNLNRLAVIVTKRKLADHWRRKKGGALSIDTIGEIEVREGQTDHVDLLRENLAKLIYMYAHSDTIGSAREFTDLQAESVVLRYVYELSSKKAGEILGISPVTVRNRAHRGRMALRSDPEFVAHVITIISEFGGDKKID